MYFNWSKLELDFAISFYFLSFYLFLFIYFLICFLFILFCLFFFLSLRLFRPFALFLRVYYLSTKLFALFVLVFPTGNAISERAGILSNGGCSFEAAIRLEPRTSFSAPNDSV
jgi:hypothetical protein